MGAGRGSVGFATGGVNGRRSLGATATTFGRGTGFGAAISASGIQTN
jgi:hypothetical protein